VQRIGAAVIASILLIACGESARDALEQARKSLAETAYPEAIASADAGLSRSPDKATGWGLELVKLEALARSGSADAAVAQLAKLGTEWPDQMKADQYVATADQLRAAGQGAAAVQALDQGLKRFPQDQALLAQIERAKKAPAPGSDELKMLETLGYIDK
jgi:hypothetical protein